MCNQAILHQAMVAEQFLGRPWGWATFMADACLADADENTIKHIAKKKDTISAHSNPWLPW